MKISKSLSLLHFNVRVLTQGEINVHSEYSYSELKKKLFFNKVFLSNIREMYMKGLFNYHDDESHKIIHTTMRKYKQNIFNLIEYINKDGIIIDINDDNIPIEVMIEAERLLRHSTTEVPMNETYPILKPGLNVINTHCSMNIQYDMNEHPDISNIYIDETHPIWSKPFKANGKYYLTMDVIWRWSSINHDTPIILFNTIDDTNKVSVIEAFSHNMIALPYNYEIIYNPMIYIDDLIQILDDIYPESPKVQQDEFEPIILEDIFKKDYLIEYPRNTFSEFLQFLSQASDPKHKGIIESIHITLYRIGSDPDIYYILENAVKAGIDVNVYLELNASGEYINEMWYDSLGKIGVNVYTTFINEFKVHSKLALIKFADGRRIAHVGTGNYHTKTTSQYTDLSLITANRQICDDISEVFRMLEAEYFKPIISNNLLVTQINAVDTLTKLIKEQSHPGGMIIIKCNSLADDRIIEQLSYAARNGCRIILIVRGICTWCPSDFIGKNVTIKSIIWDKLEHSRVFAFGTNNPNIYIGSLDLVKSKIDKRIETMVRITSPEIADRVIQYLNRYINTKEGSWLMDRYGKYYPTEVCDDV